MVFVYGNFNTMCLSDGRGQWGTNWFALERENAAHKGLAGASYTRTSVELTTKKGRLSIIHGNYRRLLKTANRATSDSQTRTL